LLLMCSALEFYGFILAFSLRRIRAYLDTSNARFFSFITNLPETIALAAFSFMTVCLLAGLLAFHAFLVAKNKVWSTVTDVIRHIPQTNQIISHFHHELCLGNCILFITKNPKKSTSDQLTYEH